MLPDAVMLFVTVKSPVSVSVVFNKNELVAAFRFAIEAEFADISKAIEALGATNAPEMSVAICAEEESNPFAFKISEGPS